MFSPNFITSQEALEASLKENLTPKSLSRYLIVSDWDQVSMKMADALKPKEGKYTDTINVVSIWDVPNVVNVLKSQVYAIRGSIPEALKNITKLPAMVRFHGTYPVVDDYNGSLFLEVGA